MKKWTKILAITLMTTMVFSGISAPGLVKAKKTGTSAEEETEREVYPGLDVSTVDADGKDTVVQFSGDKASNINVAFENTSGEKLTLKNLYLSSNRKTEPLVGLSNVPHYAKGKNQKIELIPDETGSVTVSLYANKTGWIFTKDDTASGRYKLFLNCTVYDGTSEEGTECHYPFYIYCKGSSSTSEKTSETEESSEESYEESYDSGDSGSSDSGTIEGGTPRVIITGFSTKPKKVKAGETFTLTVHMKNTSKKQKVGNLLFDFQAKDSADDSESDTSASTPAFLPTSGSSTVYLDSISAGQTADVSIELTADNSLTQAPYAIEIGMSYEDGNYEAQESTSSLTIPVKQDARYEFTGLEVTPETVSLGGEANLMGTINNMGRTTLYNAKVTFEGNGIEAEDSYIGNIGAGSSASIDAMLTATELTDAPETVTMIFSYEDSDGKEITDDSQTFDIEVTDSEGDAGFEDVDIEEESSFSFVPIIIGVIVLLVLALLAFILLRRRKKRKAMKQDIDEFADEFDDEFDDDDDDDDDDNE